MTGYRVVALAAETADEVRRTLRSPRYGHPAHVEPASGAGPCRLCLHTFELGAERRVLFTYDPFPADADMPAPGPVFVHAEPCRRHEGLGFPAGLAGVPMTLEGYDRTGLALTRVRVDGDPDRCIERVFSSPGVAYAHIRNAEAGCFIARVERG